MHDDQVPDAIRWASDTLAEMPYTPMTTQPKLFARHSLHDIRIDPLAYRWSKLPQILIRLRHDSLADVVASVKA